MKYKYRRVYRNIEQCTYRNIEEYTENNYFIRYGQYRSSVNKTQTCTVRNVKFEEISKKM